MDAGGPKFDRDEFKRRQSRRAALINERASWMQHWRELSEFQQPRLGRFLTTDVNNGRKRHNSIYNNTARMGVRTLAAGLMSGGTSPARPWFKLALADQELMKRQAVKVWLQQVTDLLLRIFGKSNSYRVLHQMYEELGLFGTAASVILPNYRTVLHHYPMTIGEYAIGCNAEGQADTMVRDFQMTVGQLGKQFGRANCSQTVKNLLDRGSVDNWVPVTHLVEPNEQRDTRKLDNRNMKFSSVYFEMGGNEDCYLAESGFKRFNVLAPRWAVTGNDVYGEAPGMEALGDVKALQHNELRKAQGLDYQTNPPLQVPTQYKNAANSRLPGGVMYVDQTGPGGGIRSAFEVQLDLSGLREDSNSIERRINAAYYVDLFMMLAQDTRSGTTAREIAERHEEKLLMLGPVLERLHNELLQPKIDIAFDMAAEANILPPAPPEMQGQELGVEFISTLAQAQRIVSGQGTERLLTMIGNLVPLNPQIVDKVNFDKAVDDYANLYGANPEIMRDDKEVAQIRADREQQQAAQQAAQAAPVMADTAKAVGGTNAANLRDVMNMFTGYGSPSSTEL